MGVGKLGDLEIGRMVRKVSTLPITQSPNLPVHLSYQVASGSRMEISPTLGS